MKIDDLDDSLTPIPPPVCGPTGWSAEALLRRGRGRRLPERGGAGGGGGGRGQAGGQSGTGQEPWWPQVSHPHQSWRGAADIAGQHLRGFSSLLKL